MFEPGGCSDQRRCRICPLQPSEKIWRPFTYVNAIGSLLNFLPMVKEYWESNEKLFHSTFAMYQFNRKKSLIREIGRDQLRNPTKRAKEAHSTLCEKQKLTLSNHSPIAIQEEAVAYEKWLHVAELEEDFLKQRAKLHWLDVGDQNNKTFHNSIKSRQAQKTIREIRCLDGSVAVKHEEINNEADRFFSAFLNQITANYQGATEDELRELTDFRCS